MPDAGGGTARGTAAREALFQERILDHYRRPRNREPLAGADVTLEWRNPLCGDEIALSLALDGDRVRDLRLHARGCSLSVAAASMLTELAPGRSRAELAAIRARFDRLLEGDASAAADPALGELVSFAGVSRVPARRRCAQLAFEALEAALERGEGRERDRAR